MMNTDAGTPAEATAFLSAVRADLDTLPEGAWNLDGASIQAKSGQYVIEAKATCNPECMGDVWSSLTPAAESFLVNSGQRTRFMLSAIESVLALHSPVQTTDEYGEADGGICCGECKDHDDHSGERVHSVWPCSTVGEITRALAGVQTRMELQARIEADVEAALARRGRPAAEDED